MHPRRWLGFTVAGEWPLYLGLCTRCTVAAATAAAVGVTTLCAIAPCTVRRSEAVARAVASLAYTHLVAMCDDMGRCEVVWGRAGLLVKGVGGVGQG